MSKSSLTPGWKTGWPMTFSLYYVGYILKRAEVSNNNSHRFMWRGRRGDAGAEPVRWHHSATQPRVFPVIWPSPCGPSKRELLKITYKTNAFKNHLIKENCLYRRRYLPWLSINHVVSSSLSCCARSHHCNTTCVCFPLDTAFLHLFCAWLYAAKNSPWKAPLSNRLVTLYLVEDRGTILLW